MQNEQSIQTYIKMTALLRQPPKKGQQVTLVITDIEGSTSLWDTMPRQMNEALATHDALLRSLMRTHHGYGIPSMAVEPASAFSIELEPNYTGVRASTCSAGAPVEHTLTASLPLAGTSC
jgi:class 3 adenylate cyclase